MRRLMALALLCVLLAGCAPSATPTATTLPPAPTAVPTATPLPAQPTAVPAATPQPFEVTGNTSVPLPEATPPPPIEGAQFYGYHITPLGFIEYYHMDHWWEPTDKPPLGTRTTLNISLIKNGQLWLGGDIYAEWWKGDELQTCSMIVIYQRAICGIYADGYQPGVFVPVTATFSYLDRKYTLHTGFAPQ